MGHVFLHTLPILAVVRLVSLRLATVWKRVFLFSVLVGTPLLAQAALRVTGSDGQSVTLAAPATRIVSLAPDLTELTYAVGAGASILATVEYSDYPAEAKALPRVGDAFHVDVEKVVALKPDLVLVWQGGTPPALIERLRGLKLPVLAIGTTDLTDIAANLELLGKATGHGPEAAKAARAFRDGLDALDTRYGKAVPIRVFYEVSEEPLFTVGGKQSISRLMAVCGGQNIFADLDALGPSVGMEAVLARDPQAIVSGDGEGDVQLRFKTWQRWPQLSAVRYGNFISVNDDWVSRATPRVLEAGKQLCEAFEKARAKLPAAH